ncbi:MAG: endonuclease III [Candidatus Odinarchaeota archaeon]|nr:endonuclease III [Candidatus Odinarchaeota archaeon]
MTIDNSNITEVLERLKKEIKKYKSPAVTFFALRGDDPFKILISTVLSLRTKDDVTYAAAERLFKFVDNPYDALKLGEKKIAELIYPVGFYNMKAKNIIKISKILTEKYSGKVPDNLEELLKLPGVGRKTANLVLILGFNKEGICVDTHVHRIVNRWGYVKTKTPEETEFALREKLPKKHWKEINNILVTWGQNVCKPIGPRCDICVINDVCPKIGVVQKRGKNKKQ